MLLHFPFFVNLPALYVFHTILIDLLVSDCCIQFAALLLTKFANEMLGILLYY